MEEEEKAFGESVVYRCWAQKGEERKKEKKINVSSS
jgi:hypothetical protein